MMTNIMEYSYMFRIGTERVQQLYDTFGIGEQPVIYRFSDEPTTADINEEPVGTVVMYTQSSAYEPDITTVEE